MSGGGRMPVVESKWGHRRVSFRSFLQDYWTTSITAEAKKLVWNDAVGSGTVDGSDIRLTTWDV